MAVLNLRAIFASDVDPERIPEPVSRFCAFSLWKRAPAFSANNFPPAAFRISFSRTNGILCDAEGAAVAKADSWNDKLRADVGRKKSRRQAGRKALEMASQRHLETAHHSTFR
jgi:hypothetical protein